MKYRVLTSLWLLLFSSQMQARWLEAQWDVMGTRATLSFWRDDTGAQDAHLSGDTDPVTVAIRKEFDRLNASLSPWIESSELYRVNARAADSAQPISAELNYLLEKSGDYYRLTDGAFDVTFASVGHLYDYREQAAPDSNQLRNALPAVGFDRLRLGAGHVRFTAPGTRIDLGGIAKGYAIDRAVDILTHAGIRNAYISLGGDSYVLGDRRGRDWQVGIRHPRDEQAVAMRLPVSNIAVSTSGDYERFFIRDGERVHHIINPKSGKSSEGLVSVTILAAHSIDADALSTSVFVMGAERGLDMINGMENVSAVLITTEGEVLYSGDLAPPSSSSETAASVTGAADRGTGL